MFQSNNPMDGAQAFSLKVEKGEDGGFTASCPQQPGVEPFKADSQSSAVNGLRQRLQAAAATGKLRSR